jgi:hypothetical protein
MARKKSTLKKCCGSLGSWSFLIGIVLAVILGLGFGKDYADTLVWVVFVLGLLVGLLNITDKEVSAFLTSGTILVLVAYLGGEVGVFKDLVPMIGNILNAILTLFVPATIIVALKAAFVLAER